jgi:hypothetical protein
MQWLRFFSALTDRTAYGFTDPSMPVENRVKAFVSNYEQRREKFEKAEKLIVKRGT